MIMGRSKFTLALMLFSILWQSLALGGQAAAFTHAHGVAHMAMHSLSEAHHHHDDGSVAQDDSDESRQHVVADGGVSSPFLWAFTSFTLIHRCCTSVRDG
ncbi:MAG: hypothetical protein DI604_26840 [Delftia acidovorans]|nr:MAG: hypothetical protein DI604_26840 [Delftia acidovorans]